MSVTACYRWLALYCLVALSLALCSSAQAASIESLVMPGPVAEAHAELEDDCAGCHAPFARLEQAALCLDCHEEVAEDVNEKLGFHGRSAAVAQEPCRSCHVEHIGRDADIRGLSEDLFEHDATDFSLIGQHAAVTCQSCHEESEPKREAPSECFACHRDEEPHDGQLGEDCGLCHSPKAWVQLDLERFAHDGFELEGGHAEASCSSCHTVPRYEDAPKTCHGCHSLDDVHDGQRGDQCSDCHSADSWELASFDHDAETGFALEGAHEELVCANCHLPDNSLEKPPRTCGECHLTDDVHLGLQGTDCGSCHSQLEWNTSFDHARQTDFALPGGHDDLACVACHVNGVAAGERDALPTSCNGCHASDDPHDNSIVACDSCHVPQKWSPAPRFHHDLTGFGLFGSHRLASCEQCHNGLAFSEADTVGGCIDCHEKDDEHSGRLGEQCESCHTVVDWSLVTFDHDSQTQFALTGAHDELSCGDCHGDDVSKPIGSGCRACHADDDVHDGQFGVNCSRCHADDSFDTLRLGVLP